MQRAPWRGFRAATRALVGTTTLTAHVRRCASGTPSSRSVPPSATASSSASQSASTRRGFVSNTKFTLSPSQVTEGNVPTARDVAAMIPTLKELKAQLPDARELESQYIGGMEAATKSPEHTRESIFQPTTDPLEDLIEGTAADREQKPTRVHVLLAYRALLLGTFYAVAGVALTVVVAMYCCGYHSVSELMDGVRDKVARDEARLRASVEKQSADGETVKHYVIDLTHPSQAMEQIREIWAAVQDMAEEEGKHDGEQVAARSTGKA